MITAANLAKWIILLPTILDRSLHPRPIPRPDKSAMVIATVCAETSVPALCAIEMDALAAWESGYNPKATGDCPNMLPGSTHCTRDLGARSCGAFQTPCGSTPPTMDALGQAKLAWSYLLKSHNLCPDHPLWMYASGACKWSQTAADYEVVIKAQGKAAPPLPLEGDDEHGTDQQRL